MFYYSRIIFLVFLLKFPCLSLFGQTAPTLDDRFSKKSGNLRMSSSKFDLGRISNNEYRYDTIHFYNSGNKPMNIALTFNNFPYMKLNITGSPLPPGGQGYISLYYDASKKNDYGFVMDRIQLNTDDTILHEKFITVTATIQDYFPIPADGDTLRIKTRIPEVSYTFNSIKQGNRISHDFKIYNDGGKTLVLHKTKTNCPCLKVSLSKTEIIAGDSATIHVEFDSSGKVGKESLAVYLFMNDPAMPEAKFEMVGEMVK